MFKLRPYQENFIKSLARSLINHKKVIACAPTGSGKTKVFIQIANSASSKGRAVIIISETTKIYEQIRDESGGIIIAEGVKHVQLMPGKIYVAMAQTLARRPLILKQINDIEPLIIVDEAHIGTPSKILRKLNTEILTLGFTATPDARVAKHLPELYNDCVVACQVDDLIQQGFLCSYKHLARSKGDLSILELKGGEYTEKSQNKAFNTSSVYEGILEDLKTVPYKKAMIFVASIKHCDDLHAQLTEAGFNCVKFHSQLENASYELAKFTKLDMADICVSVASLTKGWDFSKLDLIILNRKTSSLPLYLQMLGRGSRIHPGKSMFTVLDYGANWEQHGLYFEDREWDKLWKQTKKAKKSAGVAPVASCPNCDAILPATLRKCSYCDFIRPFTEKELQQGKLIEVTSHYSNLIGRKISTLTPEELGIYAKIKSKQKFAARIAKSQELEKPGYLTRFAANMGYKQGWVYMQQKQLEGVDKIEFADIVLR